MLVTTEMFYEAYRPPAHINSVHDAGCLWIDLENDQPAYCGLMFELSHPDIPDVRFRQLYRLSNVMVIDLLEQLLPYVKPPSID